VVDFRQALRRAARGEDQAPAQAEAPSTPSVSLFYKRSKWPEAVAAFNRDNILALFNGKRSQPEKRLARLKLGHNFFPYLPPRTLLPLFHQEFTDRGFHHVQRSAPGATSTAHIFSCQEEEKKEREKSERKNHPNTVFLISIQTH